MSVVQKYLESLDPEVLDWIKMTPQERWQETKKLWDYYISIGGSLEPEPDLQSPFFDPKTWREVSGDGRPSLRTLRK